jgi:hypothetical protein
MFFIFFLSDCFGIEARKPVPLFLVLGGASYKIGTSYLESRIAHLSGLDPQGHFPTLRMVHVLVAVGLLLVE